MEKNKKKVCPKCKHSDLVLTEVWKNHTIQFLYNNGKISAGISMEPGDPYKVEATCNNCNHSWTLKGVIQIMDF